jgi:hypothetical protein
LLEIKVLDVFSRLYRIYLSKRKEVAMKVSMVFGGSKTELDRLCLDMGFELRPVNSRFGWNYSVVSENGEKRGIIEHATTNKPCLLEIVPETADEASRLVITAWSIGAISKMKESSS